MKSLIKVSLLASIIVFVLNISSVLTTDAASDIISDKCKSSKDQVSYALGVSLGHYMNNSLKEQGNLGIKLDKDQLITGFQDAFSNNSKLSNQEIEATLQSFEKCVKRAVQTKMEQENKDNATKGDKYRANYIKQKGVKKTANGVLYKVDIAGTGSTPNDNDTVVVNYRGTLVDGTEFDNSYKRGEPLSFRLDGVIPGWTEGLKHIKKGGKIQLVIPPEQAYGKTGVPGIPASSTLIFDIELLDIKSPTAEAQPTVGEEKQALKHVRNKNKTTVIANGPPSVNIVHSILTWMVSLEPCWSAILYLLAAAQTNSTYAE